MLRLCEGGRTRPRPFDVSSGREAVDLARMLDQLYDKMYDITMPMHVRRECARQLVNYRSKLQAGDLQRYDVDRAARRYHLAVEPNDP